MESPTRRQVSTKTQEERLEAIRVALAIKETGDEAKTEAIKIDKINAVRGAMSKMTLPDQLLLMKAMDSDDNIKAKLNDLIKFLPKAVFLSATVASLRTDLEQKKAREIESQRREAKKTRSSSILEPIKELSKGLSDSGVSLNSTDVVVAEKPAAKKVVEKLTAKEEEEYAIKRNKEWQELPGEQKLTTLQSASAILQGAPQIVERTAIETTETLLAKVKKAVSNYNIAETEDRDIQAASQNLFSTLAQVDSNSEVLSGIFADQAFSKTLKSVVNFEIVEAEKSDTKLKTQLASQLKTQCPNLLAKFAELDAAKKASQEAVSTPPAQKEAKAPEITTIIDVRPATAPAKLTQESIKLPARPATAPADTRKRSFFGGIADGLRNIFGKRNRVAPAPDPAAVVAAPAVLSPEKKKRASLVSTIEEAATALKAISNESLKEGPFRVTMAIKKRNSIISGAEALDKEADSIELADLIKSAFKALDPSVPSLAIQERLASLTLADSKSTGLENPNNKEIKAILDSMPQEDKRILDLVTDSMLHCKSGDLSTGTKMTIDNLAVVLGGCMMDKYNEQNPSTVQENALKFVTIATAVLNVRELENYEKKTPGNSPAVTSQSVLTAQQVEASR